MTLSIILTLNRRPDDVCQKVADSLRLAGNAADELVIVLDRPDPQTRESTLRHYTDLPMAVRFVELTGEPGWRSPVIAWNAGFKAAVGDAFYCFSSETVQDAGNIERAKVLLADGATLIQGAAECSCGPEGMEVNWGGAAPGNVLCSAKHPRPMGFIWAAPAERVRSIGGFDEEFVKGFWHDESDLFIRLWRTGLDFCFDDAIHGVHLHHERPDLNSVEGQGKIQANAEYMVRKHGTLHPWANIPMLIEKGPGRTWWRHL